MAVCTVSAPEIIQSFQYGQHTVTLRAGRFAQQASAAVWVDVEGTTVLVTVVGASGHAEPKDFFPLTVNYQERLYAAGRIPGGYFKREGRPTEIETLRSRLMDRPIRPLFPEGYAQDVQIVATVLSVNPAIEADIPAMLGAFAALALSGLPCKGPSGAARVGHIEGQWVLNPTRSQMKHSACDLVMAGTEQAIMMVEAQANELSEAQILEALNFGHSSLQTAIQAIHALVKQVGAIPSWEWVPPLAYPEIVAQIEDYAAALFKQAYTIAQKKERRARLEEIRRETLAHLASLSEQQGFALPSQTVLADLIDACEGRLVRASVLGGAPRIDGRDLRTVRPIQTEVSILARTHGSAIFQRGETQILAVATIGTARDAQVIETSIGEVKERFMLHYNFPPYSVGETGPMSGPKRREIGHGYLAKRAFQAVLPSEEDYPYVLRVVSEVLSCNGSSSMGTICGTTLALLDAGVPLKSSVAGIAMGLVKEGSQSVILTDILGDEDHLGDMDFKVAGTAKGITALQMDIKIDGIDAHLMKEALDHARTARLHILNEMARTLDKPRLEMSEFAPRTYSFMINPAKIKDVIGKGGAVIRQMTEGTGVSIDISDDGRVNIVALTAESGEAVCRRIEALTAEIEVGKIYDGKVVRLMDFGAFVNVLPGQDGLVHISQLSQGPVDQVSDVVSVGQVVRVKVLEIDKQGRVRLSMKDL